jgi:elongation of very long chain fatty acids protein 6
MESLIPPLDHATAHVWMDANYRIPLAILTIYGIHILVLQQIMKNVEKSPAFLKPLKAAWDATLSVGSLYGAVQLIPLLLKETAQHGILQEVCSSVAQTTNPVLYFFMWSKFFELGDTTFIILGKKKLIFLHWYHHMATLMYCWNAYIVINTSGALFTGMNLVVHTIMYAYYAATYFGRLPNSLRALITGLQLLQMIAGTLITIQHLRCANTNSEQRTNSMWALAMYFSYFLLFGKLFIDSYLTKPVKKSAKKLE